MASTENSKQKLQLCENMVELIKTTKTQLEENTSQMEVIAKKTSLKSGDVVQNTIARYAASFDETMSEAAKTFKQMTEEFSGYTFIGEDFTKKAKAVNAEYTSDLTTVKEYPEITTSGDGSETFNDQLYNQMVEVIQDFIKIRRQYIDTFAEYTHGIDDAEFKSATNVIGKKTEDFTNALSSKLVDINAQLEELAKVIGIKATTIQDTATATKVSEGLNFNCDVVAGEI